MTKTTNAQSSSLSSLVARDKRDTKAVLSDALAALHDKEHSADAGEVMSEVQASYEASLEELELRTVAKEAMYNSLPRNEEGYIHTLTLAGEATAVAAVGVGIGVAASSAALAVAAGAATTAACAAVNSYRNDGGGAAKELTYKRLRRKFWQKLGGMAK